MLTETINQIREMSNKGASIRCIAKELSISTWSVQKQLRTAPKKPLTIVSPGETKSFISIIDKLSKRVEVLERFKQEIEQYKNNTLAIQPTQQPIQSNTETETKQHTSNTLAIQPTQQPIQSNTETKEDDPGTMYTTKEIEKITGKSERRIQDICKELTGKNMGIDKPGRPYRITAEGRKAIENVIKTSGRAKKNINKKLDVKIEP